MRKTLGVWGLKGEENTRCACRARKHTDADSLNYKPKPLSNPLTIHRRRQTCMQTHLEALLAEGCSCKAQRLAGVGKHDEGLACGG